MRTVVACIAVLALSAGCYRVRRFLFDGVPEPAPEPSAERGQRDAAAFAQGRTLYEHGPYAAKLCGACHEAAATNALVVPADRLCTRCHDLALDKRYVHGPFASGGCLVCHDPHSSRYRALLVSEADGFCLHCHDQKDVEPSEHGPDGPVHGVPRAHMSDQRHLLVKAERCAVRRWRVRRSRRPARLGSRPGRR